MTILPFSAEDPGASFHHLLRLRHPERFSPLPTPPDFARAIDLSQRVPHATTVLALRYADGVVIAGDRRATEGHNIAERNIQKVHTTDRWSAIAFAGAAGPCMEFAKLFRVELEHYEKLEGLQLSMDGKANKLAHMIRGNLPMAMQGLVVVPILAGYDLNRRSGRIFKYDIAGGQYEEMEFCAVGSGGKDAKGTLRKAFKVDLAQDVVVATAVEALYDAADNDAGTGGPDLVRGIFPIVKTITSAGVQDIDEATIKAIVTRIIQKETRPLQPTLVA